MDYPPRIQELLRKYWAAESSLEEEHELKAFFTGRSDNDDSVLAYFNFIEQEECIELNKVLSPPRQSRVLPFSSGMLLRVAAAVAILVIAVFSVQYITNSGSDPDVLVQDTFEDPDVAYEEAREALLLVSRKLNATQNAASEQIEKVTPYTSILK